MSTDTTAQQQKSASELLNDALQTLESLTTGATPNDAAATTTKVADEIVKGSKLLLNDGQGLDNYVYETWTGIFDLVGKTSPGRQQPIIDLLLNLRRSTISQDNDVTKPPITVQGAGILWKDLPTFGWIARDLWNFDPYDTRAAARYQTTWANWTAFLAKLTAISLSEDESKSTPSGSDALDFSTFALWSLRDAFEVTRPKDANPAAAINLAALWIKNAGKELKSVSQKGLELPQAMGGGGGEFASRGWTGFSEERWAVWREGFLVAAGEKKSASDDAATATCSDSRVVESVGEVARGAAALME